MLRVPRHWTALLVFLLLACPLARAEEKPAPPPEPAAAKPVETLSETHHTATIGGQTVRYRALAGDILLGDDGKNPKVRMFYVAYLKEGAGRERPLTFLFNGGPGSSSVWLHLGAFGPVRVPVDAEGLPGPQPWAPVANPYSILDLTDLVFIDPISTGYSRALPGQAEQPYHEVHKDIESVGELVRLFVTRQERWGSPLFLAGESYGTVRAAALADYLQRRYSMSLAGVVLVSPALNTAVFSGDPGNDLVHTLALPAFTAAAWYHKKLPPDLQADFPRAYRESQELALGAYSDALLRGADLPAAKRQEVIDQVARYTGLPADEVERDDLRVDRFTFAAKLLEKEKLAIGVLDARYRANPNGMAAVAVAPAYLYGTVDPSYQVDGVFAATAHRYLREDLKVRSDEFYEILSQPTGGAWELGHDTAGYLNTSGNLRTAMTENPRLKLFVASGRYDLVTTTLSARYIVGHLGLAPALRANVSLHEYESGHMIYLHEPSLVRLKADLAAFYASVGSAAGRK
ncbi:MAG TPA: peptidase S10 [Thermoanaerobaculia bacterium]|nr:peptidase S10 [Thermoanaerobaculia bacterium]